MELNRIFSANSFCANHLVCAPERRRTSAAPGLHRHKSVKADAETGPPPFHSQHFV